jgi:predicted DCC family thiol-disulfide oxidoreductase YuxK
VKRRLRSGATKFRAAERGGGEKGEMAKENTILLFDGVCSLCNGLVKFIQTRKTSPDIRFAPLQSPAGKSLLKKFEFSSEDIDTVVYISGGRYYLKSAAILQILRDIGRGWRLFYGLVVIPRFIRDFLYDLIARSRYRIFGKSDSCIIPTIDMREI